MFDWAAAEDRLHCIAKKHVGQFLNGAEQSDVYGFGFFCDAYNGTALLVANTEQYYLSSLRDFEARFGPANAEVFKWDIGNWEYPAGLFPSSSAEQDEFEDAWKKEYQEPLSQIENDDKQSMLEEVCFKVLRRLIQARVFSAVPSVKGVTILGPTALKENVLEKRRRNASTACSSQPMSGPSTKYRRAILSDLARNYCDGDDEALEAITNGKLDFGPWEQIFYGEFDGRRPKRVLVKVIGE
jgi:Uncharacterised protein family UPF0047